MINLIKILKVVLLREKTAAMNKKRYIITSVICDTLAAVVILLSFCYFHHVKKMTDSDGNGGVIVGGASNAGGDSADVAVNDFSDTLPDVFLDEGKVESGDGYYRSHNINLTVTEVVEKVDDYVARYIVYDVYVRQLENLFTVASTERVAFTELVDAAGDPIAAISGDFWGNAAYVAVRNGEILTTNVKIENDICVMYRDGTMEIVSPYKYTSDYFDGKDVYQIWDFGPSLLDADGKAFGEDDFDDYSDITSRNPRSSIGYYEPGHYVFIVADGRLDIEFEGEKVYSKGIRMHDFADIYEKLGVRLAYNLDGGDSAFAYFDEKILRQDYERATEPGATPRKIYDIIVIGEVNK